MSMGSWDTGPVVDSGDDVLLPRDLEDLANQFPRENASDGERASWLLRKASVYTRLAVTLDGASSPEILQEATAARAAGLALQEQLFRGLRMRLRLDAERHSEVTDAPRWVEPIGAEPLATWIGRTA